MQPDRKYSPRLQIGKRVGIAVIIENAVLFIATCAMGYIGNSVSVLADATNNLMDCASSLATLIGFKMCAKPADEHHPNGHGRMEYISGFVVSLFIISAALSFGKKAVLRIIKPQAADMPPELFWIPITAIVLKLCLAFYTKYLNKKVGSAALGAMFKDSISDAALTVMTMISLLLSPLTALPLDGIISLIISGVILWSGITSFVEHLDLLIGRGQDEKMNDQISRIVLADRNIFCSILSIVTFDYGPEKQFAFIQVALQNGLSPETAQAEVRNIIQELKSALDLDATIYWDSKIGGQYEMLLPYSKENTALLPSYNP